MQNRVHLSFDDIRVQIDHWAIDEPAYSTVHHRVFDDMDVVTVCLIELVGGGRILCGIRLGINRVFAMKHRLIIQGAVFEPLLHFLVPSGFIRS